MNNDFLAAIFYILFTIVLYIFSLHINKKVKTTLLNPTLLTSIIIILILKMLNIPYSQYYQGGKIISGALGPIVVILAVPLYRNRYNLLRNFIPIMGGVIASIITSFLSVILLCKIFNVDHVILVSLLSKSITTPMAVESTKLLGGNEAITVAAVVVTGLMGAAVAPMVVKYGRIKNNIAKGIGIGASSHALGTTKAVEMNEETGAASGLAMGVTGLATIIAIIILS